MEKCEKSYNDNEIHMGLLNEIHQTYIKKNNDYGNSFGKSIDKFGYTAALVRMEDKLNRLESLLIGNNDQKVNDESVIDTCLDLANYSIMLAMENMKRSK